MQIITIRGRAASGKTTILNAWHSRLDRWELGVVKACDIKEALLFTEGEEVETVLFDPWEPYDREQLNDLVEQLKARGVKYLVMTEHVLDDEPVF